MTPLVLIILDGFGENPKKEANAIALAATPHLDQFLKKYPHTTLEASGEAVGLPPGVMGNSEVGHLTIGAGRILYQDLSRIHHAIDDGSFLKNPVFEKAIQVASEQGKTLHLMGLLSDGGVHSHERHLLALVQMAKKRNVPRVVIHAFLDGRDTPPSSSQKYLKVLKNEMGQYGEIGTLIGRYYAMDRDQRWERVQVAYEALVDGKGLVGKDPIEAVAEAYQKHKTDEFIEPVIFPSRASESNRIQDGDAVIFFNFRPDRAREITRSLTDPDFKDFSRRRVPKLGIFICMTQYDKIYNLPVAFPAERPKKVLAEVLSERGIAQFHTAETEKYAHVTYFLNGGVEAPFPGEERLLIPSPKEVATYDKKPEMNAAVVMESAIKKIKEGCPVVLMNFANPDMVGHSGLLQATIKAVEVIDECVGKIAQEVLARQGSVLITADHGNCEYMQDEKGGPHTAHTTFPVPFMLIGDHYKGRKLRHGGGLQDVTPTILDILGIPKPEEMTGMSLLIEG